MALTKEKKKELIVHYQKNKKDTGSEEVQVAVLTEKINSLAGHLNINPKDYQSKRGLLMMVGKRKRRLNYLKDTNIESYRRILDLLDIHK